MKTAAFGQPFFALAFILLQKIRAVASKCASLFNLSDGTAVSGRDLSVYNMDHPVGVVLAPSHRAGIEEKNVFIRIPRRGNGAAFRHMGVAEQNPVHAVLLCQKEHLPVSGLGTGRVAVKKEKPKPAQRDHHLLRRVNAAGREAQSRIAVAPHGIGENVGILAEHGVRVKNTIAEKEQRIRLSAVLSNCGADIGRCSVGIGKHENFHKCLPCHRIRIAKLSLVHIVEIKGGFEMKLDRKTITMLSGMPNDRLWSTLKLFASGMGMELSERKRKGIDYDALRYTLSRITDEDICRVNEISETYKDYSRGGMRW